jgi:hypothetical protein
MSDEEEKQADQAAAKQHADYFGKPPFSLGKKEVSISLASWSQGLTSASIGGISAEPEVFYEGPLRFTDGKRIFELAHVRVTRDYDAESTVQLDGDDPFSRVVMNGSIIPDA